MKIFIVLTILAKIVLGEETKEDEIQLGTVIGIDLGTTYSW